LQLLSTYQDLLQIYYLRSCSYCTASESVY